MMLFYSNVCTSSTAPSVHALYPYNPPTSVFLIEWVFRVCKLENVPFHCGHVPGAIMQESSWLLPEATTTEMLWLVIRLRAASSRPLRAHETSLDLPASLCYNGFVFLSQKKTSVFNPPYAVPQCKCCYLSVHWVCKGSAGLVCSNIR